MTKPFIDICDTASVKSRMQAFVDQSERFISILLKVDMYSQIFNDHGIEAAETFICTGIENIQKNLDGFHLILRIDEKTIVVLQAASSWYTRESASIIAETLRRKLTFGGLLPKSSMMLVEEGEETELSLLRKLESKVLLDDSVENAGAWFVTADSIETAFRNKEFRGYVQPIYLKDGTLRSVELLSRWSHPKEGILQPSHYIPELNRLGFGYDLLSFNLKTLKNFQESYEKITGQRLIGSVNVDARSFDDPRLLRLLSEFASKHDSSVVELELVESERITDHQEFKLAMTKLKGLGYRIAIDDFGSGFGLENAHILNFDTVKIDLKMVHKASNGNHLAQNLIAGLVNTYKERDGFVVAEGIEEPKMLSCMVQLGVSGFQGFGLKRPMEVFDFLESLVSKKVGEDSFFPGSPVRCGENVIGLFEFGKPLNDAKG